MDLDGNSFQHSGVGANDPSRYGTRSADPGSRTTWSEFATDEDERVSPLPDDDLPVAPGARAWVLTNDLEHQASTYYKFSTPGSQSSRVASRKRDAVVRMLSQFEEIAPEYVTERAVINKVNQFDVEPVTIYGGYEFLAFVSILDVAGFTDEQVWNNYAGLRDVFRQEFPGSQSYASYTCEECGEATFTRQEDNPAKEIETLCTECGAYETVEVVVMVGDDHPDHYVGDFEERTFTKEETEFRPKKVIASLTGQSRSPSRAKILRKVFEVRDGSEEEE